MIRYLGVAFAVSIPLSSIHAQSPREVFALHDPQHRMPNTSISRVGQVHVGDVVFAVYFLNFVNPVSRHGQQRVAVIKNGKMLAGSVQCTLMKRGDIVVERRQVTVTSEGLTSVIRFTLKGPRPDKYFCGEATVWEKNV
jgi:CxxC motif-containing protein (DUF1111 family)